MRSGSGSAGGAQLEGLLRRGPGEGRLLVLLVPLRRRRRGGRGGRLRSGGLLRGRPVERTGDRLDHEVRAPGSRLLLPVHQVAGILCGHDDRGRELARVLEGRQEALVLRGQALTVRDQHARAARRTRERTRDRALLPAVARERDLDAFAPDQAQHGPVEARRPLGLLHDHHQELAPAGDRGAHGLDHPPVRPVQSVRLLDHALHPI